MKSSRRPARLIRPRVLSICNRIRGLDRGSSLKLLVGGGLLLVVAVGLFWMTLRALLFFQGMGVMGAGINGLLLEMILLALLTMLAFSNIITSLSTLFLSEELWFIFSTPVPVREVYLSRLANTAVHSSWMVLVFLVPILAAFGTIHGAGPVYYLVMVAALPFFLLIPAALGCLVGITLARLLPIRKTRDALLFLAVPLIIAFFFIIRFLQPERLLDPESFRGFSTAMGSMRGSGAAFLPSRWYSDVLDHFLTGAGRGPVLQAGLLCTTALALVIIGEWVAFAWYGFGWGRAQESGGGEVGAGKVSRIATVTSRYVPESIRALMGKDMRTLFRDPTQWSQLFLIVALIAIYLYNYKLLPLAQIPLPLETIRNIVAFLNLGLAGFVLSMISVRFIYPSVSLEGGAFWMIRTSPMSGRSYLAGKFAVSFVPLLMIGTLLIVLTNLLLQVTPFFMVLSTMTVLLMTASLTGLGIWMGAKTPDFASEDPVKLASGPGGILFMALALVLVTSTVLCEAWPVYRLFTHWAVQEPAGGLEWAGVVAAFSAVIVVNLAVAALPLRIGGKDFSWIQ